MGYAVFEKVRIPRDHMLMGNAKVARDGTYTKPPHAKLSYTTLLYTRVNIAKVVPFQLAQAATIASRFSVVREQGVGFGSETSGELAIISYKSQHYRLLNIFAQAYALFFASKDCEKAYNKLLNDQKSGNHDKLPSLHALTAALKAYSTQVVCDGAEDARKCCGGFGFSDMSGMPQIMSTLVSVPTLEGENHVMYQQTARYLMKAVTAIRKGEKVDDSIQYLADWHSNTNKKDASSYQGEEAFLEPSNQLRAFRHRAARLSFYAADMMAKSQSANGDGLEYADAWNKNMMCLIRAARCHIELYVAHTFQKGVAACRDAPTREVLQDLCNLFILNTMENPTNPSTLAFFEDGFLNAQSLEIIRKTEEKLMAKLLPNIIGLGDAWDFTDACLGSAIGMYDGNMYERLMAWTRQLPLNVQARENDTLHKGFRTSIQPMLSSRL